MARGPSGEAVLDRGFRMLGAFAVPGERLRLGVLAGRAGLPRPTAHRLAAALVALGALERQDDGSYVLGLRLHELAALAPRGQVLRSAAMPFLEDLHAVTRQHVVLAVRDADRSVVVERLSARGSSVVPYRVGGPMPLHATAAGRVLLAHAPAAVQEEVLGRTLTVDVGPAPATAVPLPARELREALDRARREGTALMYQLWEEPLTALAAPVRGDGGVVAALSIVTRTAAADPRELRPALLTVARAISRALVGG